MDIENKPTTVSDGIDLTNDHSVFWLDEQHNDPLQKYNIGSSKLRAIIDYLQCFALLDACVDNIEKMTHSTVFVVVSSLSCSQLLLKIHHLSHVHSVYIYGNPNSDGVNSTTLNSSGKVKWCTDGDVYRRPDELFQQLSQDIRVFLHQNAAIDTVMPFSAFIANEERTTELHSRQHERWFPYLIEALQEIPPIANGKKKFVVHCQKLYQNNQSALKFLKEFDETYIPQMAISWYTREGILYQLFNRTLRQLDQNHIFLFHFFIYDISQQLKQKHKKSKDANWRSETLYRGQRMSKTEIDFLKKPKTIYLNTFLSTTKNLDLAKIYAGVGSYPSNLDSVEQSVIIRIPPLNWDIAEKNVADIDDLSHFGGAEGEVLFSPSFLFWPFSVEYHEDEAVWEVRLSRYTETFNLRHEYLHSLIKLDVILQTIIDDENSNDARPSESDFCKILIKDIVSLVQQLTFENDDIVQFKLDKPIDNSQFELKTLALFLTSPTPRIKSFISSSTISILHDCLATALKCMENYDLALANYTKAANYAEGEDLIVTIMRKVKIAQIHKITGDYPLAWRIFHEISTDNLLEDLSYESIFNDIVVNEPPVSNEDLEMKKYQNCLQYLNYVEQRADVRIYGSIIADNYRNFGTFFLEHHDRTQSYECLNQEIKVRKRIIRYDKESRLELADTCMLAGDLWTEDNPVQARKFYRQAISHFKHCRNIGENVRMAMCWCEIGLLKGKHDANIFLRAFDLLLDQKKGIFWVGENIGRCFLCLAKSYVRSNVMTSVALENCQLALRFFLNGMPDETVFIEDDLDGCWDLLLLLHQRKSDEDGSPMLTKEELYTTWKTSDEQPRVDDEELFKILRKTRKQLRSSKKFSRAKRRK